MQQDFDAGRHRIQAESVESPRGVWLVLVQLNGYLASLPEALVTLSDADVALCVYWKVNAQMRFSMYADGILTRSFDPLQPGLGLEGAPLNERVGLAFGTEGEPRASAVTLAERLSSVASSPEWLLDMPHRHGTPLGYSVG